MQPIIEKIDPALIEAELTPDRLLRHTNKGDNEIYVVDAFNAPHTMREIGRLRKSHSVMPEAAQVSTAT